MTIELITFDLDDTLWDVTPVMQDAEAALRNWLALHAPRLGAVPVEHLWAVRSRLLDAEPMLKHRLSELRRRILFHALEDAGYPNGEAQTLAEAGFQVFLSARHQVELFTEVHPTLEALAERFAAALQRGDAAETARELAVVAILATGALASGIFLTAITDSMGFFTFLGLATLVRGD